jgi:hypothetical protein
MGLTFLLLGVGFASPVRLAMRPPAGMWDGQISTETLNLYALVAYMGWAHFLYAWQGQWRATRRLTSAQHIAYWLLIAAVLAALLLSRSFLGLAVFSLLVWSWNIAHLTKTEIFFAGWRGRVASPVLAFLWFTLTLFVPAASAHPRFTLLATLALAALLLATGDWRTLTDGQMRLPLLSLFLLGESLVWNAYSPYMSDAFRVGLYVFHIAAASFFHYLSSYFYASHGARGWKLTSPTTIILINAIVIAAGICAERFTWMHWLGFVLGPVWFTLWVALHLAASDLLPWWRRRASTSPRPASPTRPSSPTLRAAPRSSSSASQS